jgi:hypothetical protein
MQYLILIHDDPSAWATKSEAEVGALMAEYGALGNSLREEGSIRGGDPLARSNTAKLVRVRDGATTVSDGPYAETREQLGGYYLVECDSEADAIAIAARVPSARFGTVEVRGIASM